MKKNFVIKKFRPENNLRKKIIIGQKNQNKKSIQWTLDVKFISATIIKKLVKNDF